MCVVPTTQELSMDARLNLFSDPTATKALKRIVSARQPVKDSPLPAAAQELVALRVSQVNACGFCVDMHTKDALAAGESPARVSLVAAWREATFFTEAERAALDLAEQGTRIADSAGGAPDDVWANAAPLVAHVPVSSAAYPWRAMSKV
jgi:AhpD family alkylhydroperoxidase